MMEGSGLITVKPPFPMQVAQPKPVPAVIFDSSLDESIDQVLALALLFGFEAKRQIRIASVSVSRNNLNTAAFLDLLCKFYRGDEPGGFVPNRNGLPVGMFAGGSADASMPPMLQEAL